MLQKTAWLGKGSLTISKYRLEMVQSLTAGKMEKKYIPLCLCHEMYRVEAVGLSLYNLLYKITIFANM